MKMSYFLSKIWNVLLQLRQHIIAVLSYIQLHANHVEEIFKGFKTTNNDITFECDISSIEL
jgi:hypothetical protein